MYSCQLIVYNFPGYGGGHRGGHNYGGNRGGGRYDQDRRGDHPGSHANFGRRDRRDSDRRPHNSEEFKEPSAGKTVTFVKAFQKRIHDFPLEFFVKLTFVIVALN